MSNVNNILRIYEKDGKYIVINPTIPSWIVTNINGVLVLKCYDTNKSYDDIADIFCQNCNFVSRKSVVDFLKLAEKNKLFCLRAKYFYQPGKLNNIYLNMAENCNFKCSYCFAAERIEKGDGSLTFNDYINLLRELQINSEADITAVFTGGEPLMSNLTIKVAKFAKDIGYRTYLLTNGSLITNDNIDSLIEAFDDFKISMDGSTKEVFGRYRGIDNYDKVINGVNLLLSNGASVSISMVVTKENANEISNMVDRWGNLVNFMPLFPMGRALEFKNTVSLTGEEYYNVLSSDERIEPFVDVIKYITENYNRPILKCALADCEISISATGDVYPCHLLHEKQYYLGNIKDDSISEILKKKKYKDLCMHTVDCMDKCRECDFRYICGGACQARHNCETGSIDNVGDFCEYEKQGIINGIFKMATFKEI